MTGLSVRGSVPRMRVQNVTLEIHFAVPKCLCRQGTTNVLNKDVQLKNTYCLVLRSNRSKNSHIKVVNNRDDLHIFSEIISHFVLRNDRSENSHFKVISDRDNLHNFTENRIFVVSKSFSSIHPFKLYFARNKLQKQNKRATGANPQLKCTAPPETSQIRRIPVVR